MFVLRFSVTVTLMVACENIRKLFFAFNSNIVISDNTIYGSNPSGFQFSGTRLILL
jgi:hypothetical protein